ncbi:MAG: hypothetical protein MJZ61_04360 [Bacteroidales bacterium]|nr:hypothetical protein [Bacteroidales bacterium]
MALKLFKILIIFLLTVGVFSCAADDDAEATNNSTSVLPKTDDIVIVQPWWNFSIPAPTDEISSCDSLENFPSQEVFVNTSLDYIFGLQKLSADVVKGLRDIVAEKGKDNSWMNYYSPYLGVFVSSFDSRAKQWKLDTDVELDGTIWKYHLLISDLPEGSIDGKNKKAMELYYDDDFKNGVMFFSPTHFNSVRYPDKLMGRDMTGKLVFSTSSDGVMENTLYISKIAEKLSPMQMGNAYLNVKYNSGLISVVALADFPYLWFDTIENKGFSLAIYGGIDCSNSNMSFFYSMDSNSNQNKVYGSTIIRDGVDKVMAEYNQLWNTMMQLEESKAKKYEYKNPVFVTNGRLVGAGREFDKRTDFTKALSKAESSTDLQIPISPYQLSLLQIEW